MQFNIKQKYFLKALRILSGVVERNDTADHASHILFNLYSKYLLLTTNNKEVELKVKLKNIYIKKIGSTTANFNKLYNICKNFEKDDLILFNLKNEKLDINSFNSNYILSAYNSSKFPVYNVEKLNLNVKIDRVILRSMINKVSFSMGLQDVRSFLNGILLDFNYDKITLISTDGYRLSKIDLDVKNNNIKKKIILPRQSVIELYKILSICEDEKISLYFGDAYIKINIGNFSYRSKLLSGSYPNYNSFIPKNNNKFLIINNIILKKTFLRISVLCNVKSNKILINCKKNNISIKTLNFYKDQGTEEIFANYIGEEINISFNIKYLMDILSKIDDEIIEISFYDEYSSVIFREVNGRKSYSSTYILMPVRI